MTESEIKEQFINIWLDQLLAKYPLPWRYEQDWTAEVISHEGHIVAKLQTAEMALMLIEMAEARAVYQQEAQEEVNKILADAGIVD